MKCWQLVLFAAVLLAANAAVYAGPQVPQSPLLPLPQRRDAGEEGLTPEKLKERSLCTHDYQCQDFCTCKFAYPLDTQKRCVCYNLYWPGGLIVCRRSQYL